MIKSVGDSLIIRATVATACYFIQELIAIAEIEYLSAVP